MFLKITKQENLFNYLPMMLYNPSDEKSSGN